MTEETVVVAPEQAGERLDKLLAEALEGATRSAVQKWMEDGAVFCGGVPVAKNAKAKAGDEIVVQIPDPVELAAVPQDIPVDIVYEDDDLLVVNKPKGMVVHPAPGNPDGTLVNALLYHCQGRLSSINGVVRPGIVHRIDKDTAGLLIVAKNDFTHNALAEQISTHSFKREYRAVVVGHMPQESGTVDAPLGRSPGDRKKQAVNGLNPRNAVTHYEVLQHYKGFDFCKFTLETGRTHQIRVHCAYLGHPVAGDTVYGGAKNAHGLQGQCLFAAVIGFVHPRTKEYLEFSAPLPEWFEAFLGKLVVCC